MIRPRSPVQLRSPDQPIALVSISARRARILRWRDGEVVRVELPSNVPGRHKSTGHVRHDPRVRHGGSGRGQDEFQRQRDERIHQFLASVVAALRQDERIVVIGSGRLPRDLAERLEDEERGRPRRREVRVEHAGYETDRQLRARLLAEAGHPPRRRQAPRRPQVGTLRRSAGRSTARRVSEAVLDEWEEATITPA